MPGLRQAAAVAESLVPGCSRRERRAQCRVDELRAQLIGIESYAERTIARLERDGGDGRQALQVIEQQCREALQLTGSTTHEEDRP